MVIRAPVNPVSTRDLLLNSVTFRVMRVFCRWFIGFIPGFNSPHDNPLPTTVPLLFLVTDRRQWLLSCLVLSCLWYARLLMQWRRGMHGFWSRIEKPGIGLRHNPYIVKTMLCLFSIGGIN